MAFRRIDDETHDVEAMVDEITETNADAIVRVVHTSMLRKVEDDMRDVGYEKTEVFDTPRGINGRPSVGECGTPGHVTAIFRPADRKKNGGRKRKS